MPELEKQRMGSDARVLDVRSDAEFEDGHVPGALHIPYARIAVSATKLPVNTPLIVYCNSGARAAAAVSMLTNLGFDAISVDDSFARYRPAEHVV